MFQMKISLLALALLSGSSLAASINDVNRLPDNEVKAKKGLHGQVGLAAASLPEFVGSDESKTSVLPIINVHYNDRFYFKFNRLGAWLYKNDNGFRFGGVVTSHSGYDKEDIKNNELAQSWGDRDASFMAGLNVAYRYQKLNIEAGYVTDVSNNSEGAKFYTSASYTVFADKEKTLTLNARVERLDEDMVGYYYGIDEATLNTTLGVIGTYKLSKNWTAIGAVTVTALGDEVSDSVISTDDNANVALLGAVYSF